MKYRGLMRIKDGWKKIEIEHCMGNRSTSVTWLCSRRFSEYIKTYQTQLLNKTQTHCQQKLCSLILQLISFILKNYQWKRHLLKRSRLYYYSLTTKKLNDLEILSFKSLEITTNPRFRYERFFFFSWELQWIFFSFFLKYRDNLNWLWMSL